MMTKIKIKVIGIFSTMLCEDFIFIHYLKNSYIWGQKCNHTKNSSLQHIFLVQLEYEVPRQPYNKSLKIS